MSEVPETSYLDEDSTSKYFEVLVPNYEKVSGGTIATKDAFLRIGRPFLPQTNLASQADRDGAAEMWGHFETFKDLQTAEPVRNHPQSTKTGESLDDASSVQSTFYDNLGWHDHTDGNRLTTTKGDKIEIVGGNYQMLVLGRQATAGDGSIVDSSGGILWDDDADPTAVTRVEYEETMFGGTYKVTEKTTKGHVHNIFEGNLLEEFSGPQTISVTGTRDFTGVPSEFGTSSDFSDLNSSNEGTETDGTPNVVEGVWANKVISLTKASGNIKEYTKSSARIKTHTEATTAISETVTTAALSSSTNASASITESISTAELTSNVGSLEDSIASITENEYFVDKKENQIGGVLTSTQTVGIATETFVGTKHEWMVGPHVEGYLGAQLSLMLAMQLELTLAKTVNMILGMHTEFHIGSFAEVTCIKKMDIVAGDEWEFTTGEQQTITALKKTLALAIFLG